MTMKCQYFYINVYQHTVVNKLYCYSNEFPNHLFLLVTMVLLYYAGKGVTTFPHCSRALPRVMQKYTKFANFPCIFFTFYNILRPNLAILLNLACSFQLCCVPMQRHFTQVCVDWIAKIAWIIIIIMINDIIITIIIIDSIISLVVFFLLDIFNFSWYAKVILVTSHCI